MELIQAIAKRRSVRSFTDRPVSRDLVEKLILAAIQAPSACNMQAWKFIIINDQNIKNKIVDCGGSINIKRAPLGIAVIYDKRTKNIEYLDYIQSASAATENLLLQATDLGLGSCWLCHLPPQRTMRKILAIPNYYAVLSYLLIGYTEKYPELMPRKYHLEEVMNYNRYASKWPVEKISASLLLIQKILMEIYFIMPTFIKKKWLNNLIDKKFTKKFNN